MNVIGSVQGGYFQMPFAVDEALPTLSPNAAKLVMFLMARAHRHNAVELEFSQSEIAEGTGIKDRKTILKTQQEVESAGFIRLQKTASGVFLHNLLDPSTGAPIPKPERYSGVRRYRKGETTTPKPKEVGQEQAARHPENCQPTIALPPPQVPTPAQRAKSTPAVSPGTFLCKIHPNAPVWRLTDGTPRCSVCNPNPATMGKAVRQPTGAELFGPRSF